MRCVVPDSAADGVYGDYIERLGIGNRQLAIGHWRNGDDNTVASRQVKAARTRRTPKCFARAALRESRRSVEQVKRQRRNGVGRWYCRSRNILARRSW